MAETHTRAPSQVYAAQLGDQWVAVKAVKGDAIRSHNELIARIESVLNEVSCG